MINENNYIKYNWNLVDLLKNSNIDALYQKWCDLNDVLVKQLSTFCSSLAAFKKWTRINEELELIENRLFNYVSCKLAENVSDPIFLPWDQKISLKNNEYNQKFSSLTNLIYRNEKKIRQYLKDKSLLKYQREYHCIFRNKPHVLSPIENLTISKISINNDAIGSVFSTLLDEDIKFRDALDKNNKSIKLETFAKIQQLLKSSDRVLRKNAWINCFKAYDDFSSTFCKLLYHNYLQFNTYAKLHKHTDYIASTAFRDEIDKTLILNLYQKVKRFKPSYLKYRKVFSQALKKKLKINKLEPWDNNIDLCHIQVKYTIAQAQDIVLNVLKIFGNEYVNVVKKAFIEKWISWLPKANKYSGAFSVGHTKGLTRYYICMNFNESFDSLSTLIHELGHSLNSYYFTKYNPIYASTTIFTAEIPSIVNETLLGEYMYNDHKNNDPAFKATILQEIISNFFNTTSRQIVFSEFEYKVNDLVNNSLPFTKDTLKKIYLDLTDKYCGIKDKKKSMKTPYVYSLSRVLSIPHFYAGVFYVYKYAIGQIVAINIVKRLLNKEPGFLDKYFEFLKSGTSKSPLDTIKILNIDLSKQKTYDVAIEYIDEKINDFSRYASQIKYGKAST